MLYFAGGNYTPSGLLLSENLLFDPNLCPLLYCYICYRCCYWNMAFWWAMPLRLVSLWLCYVLGRDGLLPRLVVGPAACISTIFPNFLGPGSAVFALAPRFLGGDLNLCSFGALWLNFPSYGVLGSPWVVTVTCLFVSPPSLTRLLVDSSTSLLPVFEGELLFSPSMYLMGEDWTLYRCAFLPWISGVCASSCSSASRIFSLSTLICSTLSCKLSFCLSWVVTMGVTLDEEYESSFCSSSLWDVKLRLNL